jgi:hypothetical protein
MVTDVVRRFAVLILVSQSVLSTLRRRVTKLEYVDVDGKHDANTPRFSVCARAARVRVPPDQDLNTKIKDKAVEPPIIAIIIRFYSRVVK